MKLYYYIDEDAHNSANRLGQDYTPAYLPIMLDNMGITACPVTFSELRDGTVGQGDLLLVGNEQNPALSSLLKAAEAAGCFVIGFATAAGDAFPCKIVSDIEEKDPYVVTAMFQFRGRKEQLPVTGCIHQVEVLSGDTVGMIQTEDAEIPGCVQDDKSCYFTFDLPGTLWHCADGKPTPEPIPPFPLGRVPDGCILPDGYDYSIAYADRYQQFLLETFWKLGFATVYALPPKDKKAADLVLYFAGDDDAGSEEIDVRASCQMADRGLPYHLNIMPKDDMSGFVLSRPEADKIRQRGQELSLHYNFITHPYTSQTCKEQNEMFQSVYGQSSIGPVNHCLVQCGSSAERCRLHREQGAIGDNDKFQFCPDPNDINAFNLNGFAFGSAYPRFCIDDPAHGNKPLEYCEVYNSYYEPRIYKKEPAEIEKIENYLRTGVFYKQTLELFFHPHYISDIIAPAAPALEALDTAISFVREQHWNVYYCGPDTLMKWWHARAKCMVTVESNGTIVVDNPTGQSIMVCLPVDKKQVFVNGMSRKTEVKQIGGKNVTMVFVEEANAQIQ